MTNHQVSSCVVFLLMSLGFGPFNRWITGPWSSLVPSDAPSCPPGASSGGWQRVGGGGRVRDMP